MKLILDTFHLSYKQIESIAVNKFYTFAFWHKIMFVTSFMSANIFSQHDSVSL